MSAPTQSWLDGIANHVEKLTLEKSELEKALFSIASKILIDHPEDVQEGVGISETTRKILDDFAKMKKMIRRLRESEEGARLWTIIQEEEQGSPK